MRFRHFLNPPQSPFAKGGGEGFDNAHGHHHRHYMGEIETVEFVSYEATQERFQQEWLAIVKPTQGKKP